MLLDLQKSEEHFSQLMAGDADHFFDLLELERGAVFDFVMRMTGQAARAKDALDQVAKAVQQRATEFPSLQELRAQIYQRIRANNRAYWSADVQKLENAGFGGLSDGDYEASVEALQLLEQALAKLSSQHREVVLLRYRHAFDESAIAVIVGAPVDAVIGFLKASLRQLMTLGFADDTDFAFLLEALPQHPVPERTAYSTMALSALMSELKDSHRRPISDARWFLIALVIGIIAVAVVLFLMGSPIFSWWR